MNNKKWRALVRAMKKSLPVEGSVTVRRRPMKAHCGKVTFDGRDYLILVDPIQDDRGQVDSLIHEYAHVLAIEAAYGHGESFGVAYAKTYCAAEDHADDWK